MTARRFVVTLGDATTATIDAEAFTIPDGVLTFLVADADPPSPLRPVFALARGWKWIEAADAGVSWSGAQQQHPESKPPRLIPATQIPKRAGW